MALCEVPAAHLWYEVTKPDRGHGNKDEVEGLKEAPILPDVVDGSAHEHVEEEDGDGHGDGQVELVVHLEGTRRRSGRWLTGVWCVPPATARDTCCETRRLEKGSAREREDRQPGRHECVPERVWPTSQALDSVQSRGGRSLDAYLNVGGSCRRGVSAPSTSSGGSPWGNMLGRRKVARSYTIWAPFMISCNAKQRHWRLTQSAAWEQGAFTEHPFRVPACRWCWCRAAEAACSTFSYSLNR